MPASCLQGRRTPFDFAWQAELLAMLAGVGTSGVVTGGVQRAAHSLHDDLLVSDCSHDWEIENARCWCCVAHAVVPSQSLEMERRADSVCAVIEMAIDLGCGYIQVIFGGAMRDWACKSRLGVDFC